MALVLILAAIIVVLAYPTVRAVVALLRWLSPGSDWPMPKPPPYPADDEGQEKPTDG